MTKLELDCAKVAVLSKLPEGRVREIYNGCFASGFEIRRLANGLEVQPGDLMLRVVHPSEVGVQLERPYDA